jgi:hypothetical protein
MPRWALIAVAIALLAGCCKERDETVDDLHRFGRKGNEEVAQLRIDINRFVISNALNAQNLPFDADRFIEWRKREWWYLRDELAWTMVYEWQNVERLTTEVARYYGYNVQNFPRAWQDVLNFFAKADAEWRNLVMDVCVWVEYQNRELTPLREDLHRFYDHTGWEVANLDIDVRQFIEWRDREYRKLVRDGRDWFAANLEDWDKLQYDVERFRAHAAVEQERMTVDLACFWAYEHGTAPRLVDDVYRYTQWREREWRKFCIDVDNFAVQHTRWESERLEADLWRYKQSQLELIPKLMLDVDRFFQCYEREVRPLTEEVKRWWRYNIAIGRLAIEDLKHFYQNSDEEVAELEADMKRFVGYGGKEWLDLVAHVKRFATCAYDPAFGDSAVPAEGSYPPAVMDDYAPLREDINR